MKAYYFYFIIGFLLVLYLYLTEPEYTYASIGYLLIGVVSLIIVTNYKYLRRSI